MKKLTINDIQFKMTEAMMLLHDFCVNNNIKYYIIAGSMLGSARHSGFIPWDDDIDVGMLREDYDKFLRIKDRFDNKYEIKNYTNDPFCDYLLTRIFFKGVFRCDSILNKKVDNRLYLDVFPIDFVPNEEREWNHFSNKVLINRRIIGLLYPRRDKCFFPKKIIKKIISLFLLPFRKIILKKASSFISSYQPTDKEKAYVCSCASQYSPLKQKMPLSVYGSPKKYIFDGKWFYGPSECDSYLTQLYGKNYMDIPPASKRRIPTEYYEE